MFLGNAVHVLVYGCVLMLTSPVSRSQRHWVILYIENLFDKKQETNSND